MKPIKLMIKTNSEKYPIFIGKNLISKISSLMVNNSIKSKKCLLLVDRNVPKNFISEIKKKLRNKKKRRPELDQKALHYNNIKE